MASEKLTVLKVARARTSGMIGDGKGLWLRVAPGGSKSWIFRFMIAGRGREMGLGSAIIVSLAEARAARDAAEFCAHRPASRPTAPRQAGLAEILGSRETILKSTASPSCWHARSCRR